MRNPSFLRESVHQLKSGHFSTCSGSLIDEIISIREMLGGKVQHFKAATQGMITFILTAPKQTLMAEPRHAAQNRIEQSQKWCK